MTPETIPVVLAKAMLQITHRRITTAETRIEGFILVATIKKISLL
jgi:hypothetical protein